MSEIWNLQSMSRLGSSENDEGKLSKERQLSQSVHRMKKILNKKVISFPVGTEIRLQAAKPSMPEVRQALTVRQNMINRRNQCPLRTNFPTWSTERNSHHKLMDPGIPGELRFFKNMTLGSRPSGHLPSAEYDSSPKGSILVEDSHRWCRATGRRYFDSRPTDKIYGNDIQKFMSCTTNTRLENDGSEISPKIGDFTGEKSAFDNDKVCEVQISDGLKNASQVSDGYCEMQKRRKFSLSGRDNVGYKNMTHQRLGSHGDILKVPLVHKNPILDGKLIKSNFTKNTFFVSQENGSGHIQDELQHLLWQNPKRSPCKAKPIFSRKSPTNKSQIKYFQGLPMAIANQSNSHEVANFYPTGLDLTNSNSPKVSQGTSSNKSAIRVDVVSPPKMANEVQQRLIDDRKWLE